MTREEHLKFCKVCKNRKFDKENGLVCGLTDEIADFNDECPNYLEDAEEKGKELGKIQEGLKDNSARASTAVNVFWGIIVINMIAIFSGYLEIDLLERFNEGAFVSDEEAEMNDLRQGLVGLAQAAVYIASIVVFLNWFRRAYGNLSRIGCATEHEEKMAIWSFMIPFINLVRPFQIAKEIFHLTSQKLLELDKHATFSSANMIIGIWWTFFIITNIIGNIVFKMTLRGDDSISDLITQGQVYLLADSIDIPAAFVTLVMIKKISEVESLLFQKVA